MSHRVVTRTCYYKNNKRLIQVIKRKNGDLYLKISDVMMQYKRTKAIVISRYIHVIPTYRNDNAKCSLTIKHLCDHILTLKLDIVDNSNICGAHLGKRGLHMNGKGIGRLAMNIISCMQGL